MSDAVPWEAAANGVLGSSERCCVCRHLASGELPQVRARKPILLDLSTYVSLLNFSIYLSPAISGGWPFRALDMLKRSARLAHGRRTNSGWP